MAPGRVGANVAARSDVPWAITAVDINGRQVPLLSITHFSSNGDKAWHGFLAAVDEALRSAPALILDLRGNSGGDESWGLQLAARLAGLPHAPGPVMRMRTIQSAAALAATANASWLEMQEHAQQGKTPPARLSRRFKSAMLSLKALGRRRTAVADKIEAWTPESFSPGENAFRRPILVLIDRACAAACERTVLALECHPDVKWIGEPTAGAVHFGLNGVIRLPTSGIEVQLPTAVMEFQDKRFLERTGIQPHLPVAPGQDALATARTELTKLASPAKPNDLRDSFQPLATCHSSAIFSK
jgi:C-terminal processing protease CtpA/Prc